MRCAVVQLNRKWSSRAYMAFVANERQLGLIAKRYIKNQIRKENVKLTFLTLPTDFILRKSKQKTYLFKTIMKE